MTQEKRFAPIKTPTKTKSLLRNIEVEQQIHPACYQHATIYDLENEEEVDTKRNYKLFTYHIEHRYNTLVPDINFRLHFKVKDYIDAQEEADEDMHVGSNGYAKNQEWPPLSEEYVQRYINLENHVLQLEIDPSQTWDASQKQKNVPLDSMGNAKEAANTLEKSLLNLDSTNYNDHSSVNDSGVGSSILESSINTTHHDSTYNESDLNNTTQADREPDTSTNSTQILANDSALGESILDQSNNANEMVTELRLNGNTLETSDQVGVTTVTLENGIVSECECKAPNEDSSINTENKDNANSKAETSECIDNVAAIGTLLSADCAEITDCCTDGTFEKETSVTASSTEANDSGDGTTENNPDTVIASGGTAVTAEINPNGEKFAEPNGENKSLETEAKPNESDPVPKSTEGDQINIEKVTTDQVAAVLSNEESTNEKNGFLELEIHVMNENDKGM